MASKYDEFWTKQIADIQALFEQADHVGVSDPYNVSEIAHLGQRDSWYGLAIIKGNRTVSVPYLCQDECKNYQKPSKTIKPNQKPKTKSFIEMWCIVLDENRLEGSTFSNPTSSVYILSININHFLTIPTPPSAIISSSTKATKRCF